MTEDMQEETTLPLLLVDLPEATVSCWFLQEGEQLSPGPLVSLRAHSHVYTLVVSETDQFLQVATLQRIKAAEGAQVTRGSCLALLQLADAVLEMEPCSPTATRDQDFLFRMGLLAHPYAHTMALARRSHSYRRWYRRFYPLFDLGAPAFQLCLIAGCRLLLQFLVSHSLGDDPALTLYATLSFWALLLALIGFGLLLIPASVRVVANARQRVRWEGAWRNGTKQQGI